MISNDRIATILGAVFVATLLVLVALLATGCTDTGTTTRTKTYTDMPVTVSMTDNPEAYASYDIAITYRWRANDTSVTFQRFDYSTFGGLTSMPPILYERPASGEAAVYTMHGVYYDGIDVTATNDTGVATSLRISLKALR